MNQMDFGSVTVDAEDYERWQKQVIYEPKHFADQQSDAAEQRRSEASKLQDELVAKVEEGPAAIEKFMITGVLKISDLDAVRSSVPALPNPLTAGEMSKLPRYAETQVADALEAAITPARAAEPAVWALCHAVWMGSGMFGGDLPTVFLYGGKANTQEARVRNFLRRTGGLRPVRGNTSPLVNCPISTAWWRVRLAGQSVAESQGELHLDEVHDLLRVSHVWENLVGMSLRQVTSVCAPRARAAILLVLSSSSIPDGTPNRNQVQGVIRALGRLGHSHSLNATPLAVLVDAAAAGLESVGDAADGEDVENP